MAAEKNQNCLSGPVVVAEYKVICVSVSFGGQNKTCTFNNRNNHDQR